ncbi:MAG: hypothetical protein ACTSPV_14055 [Candidatus Hodarchaeales archaeon]
MTEIEEQLDIIIGKIDLLINISSINSLQDKNLTEKIGILAEIGLDNSQTSNITGANINTVRNLKSRHFKRKIQNESE